MKQSPLTIGVHCSCQRVFFVDKPSAQSLVKCSYCARTMNLSSVLVTPVRVRMSPWRLHCECGNRFFFKRSPGQKRTRCPGCGEMKSVNGAIPSKAQVHAEGVARKEAEASLLRRAQKIALIAEKARASCRREQECVQFKIEESRRKDENIARAESAAAQQAEALKNTPFMRKTMAQKEAKLQSLRRTNGRCRHCGRQCAPGIDVCYTCGDS